MKSDDWAPAWVTEHRPPSFINGGDTFADGFESMRKEEFSVGIALCVIYLLVLPYGTC
jgi:hypothetical protein